MERYEFVPVSAGNASREGFFCIKNPNYPGFHLKLDWLKKRIPEGLKLVLLKVGGETIGFIEYIPGEFAWRPVKADGYLFIHCMWVFPKKNLGKGYGSMLIQFCEEDARKQGKNGVAAVTSNGAWMTSPAIFQKNGFDPVQGKGRFVLMAKSFTGNNPPAFLDWEQNLPGFQGLNLVYANQCPLFIKSVDEMKETARSMGYELKVTVLDSADQIRNAGSGYGVYSLIWNGKLPADHYISNTRFQNILSKEIT